MLLVLHADGVMKEGCGSSLSLEWGLFRPQLARDYNLNHLDWLHVLQCHMSQ